MNKDNAVSLLFAIGLAGIFGCIAYWLTPKFLELSTVGKVFLCSVIVFVIGLIGIMGLKDDSDDCD